ncbi:MAG: exodeoxyribonuclease VII large subunit [Firmicutes bacterium]|nr:exodeoxyribonuclease VII large subunit [Bacillota bacterium]MBQ9605231.1 exodeoxyribonuclease VII large subunit [Bacillota bacterium]
MQVNVYTVSQINGYIKRVFENDVFLSDLYIEGEISNFKPHTSGHLYFSLKDKTGSVDCVMFRSDAAGLGFMPENGMGVLVRGRVSLYEKTGRYQLYVSYMQPQGMGALHIAFEQLKAKLQAEGLFDAAYKKPIPEFPETVAVITSPTGAAVRDIIKVARHRNPSVKLVIIPVLVQGENAAADIACGIERANRWGGADTIIVGRGGGSAEDLWAFNEEIVARAIFASEIPVISAVGHEVDFTIADFAADMRAATPSNAAEIAVPASQPLDKRNKTAYERINNAMAVRLANAEMRLKHALSRRGMREPLERIYNLQLYLENMFEGIEKKTVGDMELKAARFEKSLFAIESLSPMNVVKRGYMLAFDKDDKLITDIDSVNINDNIALEAKGGRITAEVKAIERGGKYGS